MVRKTSSALSAMMSLPCVLFATLCLVGCGSGDSELTDPVKDVAPVLPENLPLYDITALSYIGAFRISPASFGDSNANFSSAIIAYNPKRHSLFMVGHDHHQAIAEWPIPELSQSETLSDLPIVKKPLQSYSRVFPKLSSNPDKLDRITGLLYLDGKLVVNAYEYYDAPANNVDTTLVLEDADDLAGSAVRGPFRMDGRARASGWLSYVPEAWRASLGGNVLSGFGNGRPINGRLSIGPSAYVLQSSALLAATGAGDPITAKAMQSYSLANPLHPDMNNRSGENELWTELSAPTVGVVVSGTRTYMVLGRSGGHVSGIGYKLTRDNGSQCGGFCAFDPADYANYFWLFDLRDWLAVQQGVIAAHEVRPYAYGAMELPFQTRLPVNAVGGASYDADSGTLWLTIRGADNEAGRYSNPPVVAAFKLQ